MHHQIDAVLDGFEALIAAERASDYSRRELDRLYEMAINLRTCIERFPADPCLPGELWTLLQNIDFGAINREYRSWVLDDAEKALASFRLSETSARTSDAE